MPRLPNSSEKSANSLHLVLKPSRLLIRGIAMAHILAGLCAVANPLPWWAKFLLLIAIGGSFRFTYRDFAIDPVTRGVVLHSGGSVEAMRRSGRLAAVLAEGSVVTPWIVILNLRTDSTRIAIPIGRDSLDAESFRRLRVGLRCGMWRPDRV